MKNPRKKAYRPRVINIPMMVETRDDLALSLRMTVEALITAPSVETYNAMSLQLVTLGRLFGKQQFMEAAKRAMLDVFARYERVDKIGVNAAEAAVLRCTVGAMDAALARVPVNKVVAAEKKTRQWCSSNNVAM
jgi:hypothetical protein